MTTLLLQAAGAAVGSAFGPLGTIVGRAAGALAGYALDQSLFGDGRTRDGARLADLEVQTSREGAAIPRVYGRVRIAGEMIWATRFEEVASETDEGGKGGSGGSSVRTYSYFANFAIGLCEGPIAGIGRVWADGKPFDLTGVTWRLYRGGEAQEPDSLIEAKQGEGAAPAYRGTAYVVFERLALENFGNRVPLLSFEVIRPVGGLEKRIRAVTVIPGATEFGYDPEPVRQVIGPGAQESLNRHVDTARSDWTASLDQLQAVCPNLASVGLVVSWFGDDLRASECTLRPGVVDRTTTTEPAAWTAAGLTRATAHLVSQHAGKAAYGGTPSDASVVRAIRDLDERGLKVLFYPFVMMDIAAGNGLADPYGEDEQAAYPWRGSMTASIAPGLPGSPDKTAALADEIAAFVGTAAADDFALSGDGVVYSGPDEWSFRRLVLHSAWLCKAAGGVDSFLIGSEMCGLTTLRSGASTYPFVDALVALASDARSVLGPATKISYGADWSEYFGHHPADGSGDVFFHLDPLWADDAIDFVAIDNYMPLADWRDGSDHLDAEDWDSVRSVPYLRSNIAGGEGFDWFYASPADRNAQVRTPITDGAYGKPGVFRNKDLVGWWGNQHFDRPGGVEAASPTAWQPEGKAIRFSELGCPAVDKGPNQPNVFPDPKSSVAGVPYFSTGVRDDLVQRRFLDACLGYWDPADPDFETANNPASGVYAGRMLDHDATYLWTWDARPFPAFPAYRDVWADGENWETGHWLTGRLGAVAANDLVAAVLADYGIAGVSVGEVEGMLDGYVVDEVTSARGALEPLAGLMMFEAIESGENLAIVARGRRAGTAIADADLAEDGGAPLIAIRRAEETELPAEIAIGFGDTLADFRPASVTARRLVGGSERSERSGTNAVMSHAVATGLADAMLQDLWARRERFVLSLTAKSLALEPADICDVAAGGTSHKVMITRVEDGAVRRVEARSVDPAVLTPVPATPRVFLPPRAPSPARPEIMLLDLPLLSGDERPYAPRIAAFAAPWPGTVVVRLGGPDAGFVTRQGLERRAVMGELVDPLAGGPAARWDRANTAVVKLYGGALAALPELAVLNGGNIAAIGTASGGFEVVQFAGATLIAPATWRLNGLLRGQAGTGDIGGGGHAAGARFVLLDRAVESLKLSEAESGLELTLRCGPAGVAYDPDFFVDVPLTAARRGLRCLAPVHLRAKRSGSDILIEWVRQTRIGGDAWEPVEVPLGEAGEAYRVDILYGAAEVRMFAPSAPSVVYSGADQIADFGALLDEVAVRVRQVSATEGPGLAAERVLTV